MPTRTQRSDDNPIINKRMHRILEISKAGTERIDESKEKMFKLTSRSFLLIKKRVLIMI